MITILLIVCLSGLFKLVHFTCSLSFGRHPREGGAVRRPGPCLKLLYTLEMDPRLRGGPTIRDDGFSSSDSVARDYQIIAFSR